MPNVIDLPAPQRIPRRPDDTINVEQLEREFRARENRYSTTFGEYLAAVIKQEYAYYGFQLPLPYAR